MNDQSIHDHYDRAWKMGYSAALDAAREAVAALNQYAGQGYTLDDYSASEALAAIDTLRES